MADEVHDVERGAVGVEGAQVVAEARPLERHPLRHVEREATELLAELGGHRSRREAAVADHLGGHALADLGLGSPIRPQAPVRVRVHVDEAGREDLARRVERGTRVLAAEVADDGDRLVGHADVDARAGGAGAVDDGGALDLEVEHQL